MSHTPGPWDISGPVTGDNVPVSHTGTPENFGWVCICQGRDAATNEANARLICAAPALLAACKALPLDCEFEDAADFKDNAERLMRAMELAREAIARAEGKEQA